MSRQVIFYGAGEHAKKILGKHPKLKITPKPLPLEDGVCFVDSDVKKQGTYLMGLPVLSIEEALNLYKDADIYISIGNFEDKKTVYKELIKKYGVKWHKIYGGVRLSCHYLEKFIVCGYHECAFGGKAGKDCGMHSFKSCCSDYGKNAVATVPINGDLSRAFNQFLELRFKTIENINLGIPTKCDNCIELKEIMDDPPNQFYYLIYNELGICNSKCCYCNYEERLGRDVSLDVDFIELMKLVNEYGFDKEGIVELCNGEITINPHKQEIYSLLRDKRVMFLTNGLVYDEFIQKKLLDATGIINISLDCGTRETFIKVKGIDGYNRVINNLKKYSSGKKGIFNIKYIVLPTINDNIKDIDNFIQLCLELKVDSVHISHNLCLSYKDYNNQQTIDAVKYFIERLKKNSLPYELYSKNIIEKLLY